MDYSSFIWFETRFPNMNVESGCYLLSNHKPTITRDPCDFIAVLPAIENRTSIRVYRKDFVSRLTIISIVCIFLRVN